MKILAPLITLLCIALFAHGAEPTESREWKAKSGHTVEAKALAYADGKVQLEKTDGKKVAVPLDTFAEEDQDILRSHFGIHDPSAGPPPPAEGEAADDLGHPLGQPVADIACGGDFHYHLYLPKSLRKGAKHPVLFVMSPGGGGPRGLKRYQQGAERNRWILALSKESKNGFNGSQDAINAMIKHVTESLPIDEDRMYTTGFSGGSRMAFSTSQVHKDIAGVIACGAGGDIGSSKQVVYGLCGSNCFNRTDMAAAARGYKSKDCVLRYFPGQHVWANDELCDDAITHLNGVFLIKNQSRYPDEFAHYTHEVAKLYKESKEQNPHRAFMWTSFLIDRDVKAPDLEDIHDELENDPANKLYLEGFKEIGELAKKHLGDNPASEWKAQPKASAAFEKEAEKYIGSPWQEVLTRLANDAQKF